MGLGVVSHGDLVAFNEATFVFGPESSSCGMLHAIAVIVCCNLG